MPDKVTLAAPTIRAFYPWAISLVSCVDEAGKPNAITIGASSVCSASPPTIGVAIGTRQYSLGLIQRTGDFGVNLPDRGLMEATDRCGVLSGRNCNKFEAAGLTVQAPTIIQSPLIAECPVTMECKVVETVHLGSHDWVIGEIVAVHVAEGLLKEGELDASQLDPLLGTWGEYWSLGAKLEDWMFMRKR
jgi:flavin reductase (DIM6/NTAB) family NADH-FMN oxidoreductase RutF